MTTDELLKRATARPWVTSWGKYLPIIANVKGVARQIGRLEIVGDPPVMSDEECEANAELLRRAVNSFETMRAALKALKKRIEAESHLHIPALEEHCCHQCKEIMDAERALALADGEA